MVAHLFWEPSRIAASQLEPDTRATYFFTSQKFSDFVAAVTRISWVVNGPSKPRNSRWSCRNIFVSMIENTGEERCGCADSYACFRRPELR